ncbi:hypothetical protein CGSSp19BS75_00040 [Streptococcus pneumoniae SP19-BS75]|nr:hypothetical protein CGSSp19BS75_00040 [Streptococcus pneumoniae SP19-BS75]
MAEVDMVFVPTDNIILSTMETVKQVSIKHKVQYSVVQQK